jgi:hypothetical protein
MIRKQPINGHMIRKQPINGHTIRKQPIRCMSKKILLLNFITISPEYKLV